MSTAQSIREYFLLAQAQATAKRMGEEHRGAVSRRLQLGRQRAEAADALWSNGHTAEGLRLSAEAFEETLGALSGLADALALPEAQPAEALEKQSSEAETKAAEPKESAEAEEEESEEKAAAKAEEEEAEEGEEKPAAKADEEKAEEGEEKPAAKADEEEAEEAEEKPAAKADEEEAEEGEEKAAAKADEKEPAGEAAKADEEAPGEAAKAEEPEAHEPAAEKPPAPARPSTGPEPRWAAALRVRGLSDRKLRAVRETDEALRKTELPPLDDDVSPSHAELFQQLVTARRHADRVLAPAAMTPSQLRWTRISRFSLLAVVAVVAVVGIYLATRTPHETTAIASAVYANHADFQPEKVVDGDPESEWLLPDHQTGWVEVRISPPERIDTLRLRNIHNRNYNDRATKDYTVELYSGGSVVRTVQGTWPRLIPNSPPWTEHQMGVDNVDRIRFVVRSSHNYGGGLAEMEWQ